MPNTSAMRRVSHDAEAVVLVRVRIFFGEPLRPRVELRARLLDRRSWREPRGRDPNVAPYYDEPWSFLRARISGDLPAGPVTRVPDERTTAN